MLCTGCHTGHVSQLERGTETVVTYRAKAYFDLAEFRNKIRTIHDEESSRVALDQLVAYVKGNAARSKNFRVQALQASDSLEAFALKEASLRSKGYAVQQAAYRLSAADLARVTNACRLDPQTRAARAEDIEAVRDAVRRRIPELALQDAAQISPMEAIIICYVLRTGDDGSAPLGTFNTLDPTEIDLFLTKLAEI